MKAIETSYRGFLFRSRMEARWAVFMDAMHIPFEYEREGYNLDGLFYLPDFWLPQTHEFLEIKPVYPTVEESEKASRLAMFTGFNVYIAYSNPEIPKGLCVSESAIQFSRMDTDQGIHPGWDNCYWWCECPHCLRCELQFSGTSDRIKCNCKKRGDSNTNYESKNLVAAYNLAKSYRF